VLVVTHAAQTLHRINGDGQTIGR